MTRKRETSIVCVNEESVPKVVTALIEYEKMFGYLFPIGQIDAHNPQEVEALIAAAEEGIRLGEDILPIKYPNFDKERWLAPHTGIIWD